MKFDILTWSCGEDGKVSIEKNQDPIFQKIIGRIELEILNKPEVVDFMEKVKTSGVTDRLVFTSHGGTILNSHYERVTTVKSGTSTQVLTAPPYRAIDVSDLI